MTSLKLLLVLLAVVDTVVSLDGCLDGWEREGFQCYKANKDILNYTDAKAACSKTKGAMLSTQRTKYEEQSVTRFARRKRVPQLWVGLRESYSWADDTPLGDYTNWKPDHTLKCVTTLSKKRWGRWIKVDCQYGFMSVCQMPSKDYPCPGCPEPTDPNNPYVKAALKFAAIAIGCWPVHKHKYTVTQQVVAGMLLSSVKLYKLYSFTDVLMAKHLDNDEIQDNIPLVVCGFVVVDTPWLFPRYKLLEVKCQMRQCFGCPEPADPKNTDVKAALSFAANAIDRNPVFTHKYTVTQQIVEGIVYSFTDVLMAKDLDNDEIQDNIPLVVCSFAVLDTTWGFPRYNLSDVKCQKYHSWNYDDPSLWAKNYPDCAGSRQSPILLDFSDTTPIPHAITVYDGYSTPLVMTLQNNGHTADIKIDDSDLVTVSGPGLPGTFRATQIHFHWGANDSLGSEHQGRRSGIDFAFPMEMQIVHVNTKYNLKEARENTDGLAVLAACFELVKEDNAALEPIIMSLKRVVQYDSEVSLPALTLSQLLPYGKKSFLRYSGSLTTPGCNEVVTWTVFKNTVPISQAQLAEFRTLKTSENKQLVNNFRPVQPINGRLVGSTIDV